MTEYKLKAQKSGAWVHIPPGLWLEAEITGFEMADDVERLYDPDTPLARIKYLIQVPNDNPVEISEIVTYKLTPKSKLGRRVTNLAPEFDIDWSGEVEYDVGDILVGRKCKVEVEDKAGDDGSTYSRVKEVIADDGDIPL